MSTKKDWKKHFHRMKQIADQNLGRAEKSEVLNEDLVLLEKRVNKIKAICQSTIKKLSACLPLWGSANPDKSFKKLPESMLALTMMDSAALLGSEDTLGVTYSYCAKLQSSLAREIFQYTQKVENLVVNPLQSVLESEIPTISKLRKQLTKLTLDMDSAKGRFQSMLKQSAGNNSASLSSKVETLKNEMEQAETRVLQCRDQLIIEMYSFLAREGQLSDALLALINSQIEFHRRTLESLENSLPQMKQHTESSISRPVFGCSLESHLKHTNRDIAVVIEKCVRSLIMHGINEEGLFRVPSSSTKVKKLKAGFDANIINMDDYQDDSHCVAAVLKSYLRELPEPLMTFELYNDWMNIMQLPGELRQNALWVVVDKLPKSNYNNLRYIIKFLAKLAANSDCNKMSPSNIAIVIGPNLLWAPGDNGPSVLTATSHSAIIEILINKSEWFFPGELDFGVNESQLTNIIRNRLKDGSSNGQTMSSMSKMNPSYISKHRFFGGIFDDSDRGSLKMSPSNTRLSLNSLTSLNDSENGFERKYSFSSLLEERTSNWDSENSSLKWRKLSRVESGMLSLSTSFSYANRSPIPSSSTSPAISMANALTTDSPSPLVSVTKSPTLSFTTNSARLSPLNLSTSTNARSRLSPTASERPLSATASGSSPTCESLTTTSSVNCNPLASVSQSIETRTTSIPFSSCGSSLSDASVFSQMLQSETETNGNLALPQCLIESQTVTEDSLKIPYLLSPVFLSSDTSMSISATSDGNPECSEENFTPLPLDHNLVLVKQGSEPERNEEFDEFHADTRSSESRPMNPEISLTSAFAAFVELSLGSPNELSKTILSNKTSGECFAFAENSDVCADAVAKESTAIGNTTEKSPWINKIGAKLRLSSGNAPGKERVKLSKNFQRVGSAFHREKPTDRRSSEPPSDTEPVKTKQPLKKSLSASLPYDVKRSVSKAVTRKASSAKSSDRQTTMAAEKTMTTVGSMATGDTMTAKNGNVTAYAAGSSVIFSVADTAAVSRNDIPIEKAEAVITSSTVESVSDKCCVAVDCNGKNLQVAKEFCVSENLVLTPSCVDTSFSFLETLSGTCSHLRYVESSNESGEDHIPQSKKEIPQRTLGKPNFPPPDTGSEELSS